MLFIISCVFVLETTSQGLTKEQKQLNINTYLRAVELQAAPYTIEFHNALIHYRIVIIIEEIYKSIIAECIEFSGTEGSIVKLRYSKYLGSEMFAGDSHPGYEGVDIHIVRWSNKKEVICHVGKEYYKITFDPNPNKVKVNLLSNFHE